MTTAIIGMLFAFHEILPAWRILARHFSTRHRLSDFAAGGMKEAELFGLWKHNQNCIDMEWIVPMIPVFHHSNWEPSVLRIHEEINSQI